MRCPAVSGGPIQSVNPARWATGNHQGDRKIIVSTEIMPMVNNSFLTASVLQTQRVWKQTACATDSTHRPREVATGQRAAGPARHGIPPNRNSLNWLLGVKYGR